MKPKRLLPLLVLIVLFAPACAFSRALRQDGADNPPPATASSPEKETPAPEAGSPGPTAAAQPLKQLDVPYYDQPPGQHPKSTSLDIYAPGGSGLPVLVYVHGGGWTADNKSSVDRKPEAFNAAGFVFISLNYRMLPEVDVVTEAQDVAHAVAWVHAHAGEFGGDASRIFLMGHSAGCHLVALVGTDGSYLQAEGLSLAALKGVVALDTQAYDITTLMSDPRASEADTYRNAFGSDPDYWKKLSPLTYVAPDQGIPPFIVAYSGGIAGLQADSRAQAAGAFVQALQDAGVTTSATAALLPAPDKTHGQINQEIGLPGDPVTQAIMEFLQRLI